MTEDCCESISIKNFSFSQSSKRYTFIYTGVIYMYIYMYVYI